MMKEAGLVLEGGGNRGIFTAGVLDYFMEQNLSLPYVVGVSAGACNAIDYVSNQRERTKLSMLNQKGEDEKKGLRYLLEKRSLIDMDLIFDEFPKKQFPFDFETYFGSNITCEIVATNCVTGKADYLSETEDRERLLTITRASCSLPFVTPVVTVDDTPYLDGGVADPIPIRRSLLTGHKKNVIILTREAGYRKKRNGLHERVSFLLYKDYPKFIASMQKRHFVYNKTLDLIERLEAEGRVFVIRPEKVLIGRTEKNNANMEAFYQQGYDIGKQSFEAMIEYLNK